MTVLIIIKVKTFQKQFESRMESETAAFAIKPYTCDLFLLGKTFFII